MFRAKANLLGKAVSRTDEKDCVNFFADPVSLCATGYYQPALPSNTERRLCVCAVQMFFLPLFNYTGSMLS